MNINPPRKRPMQITNERWIIAQLSGKNEWFGKCISRTSSEKLFPKIAKPRCFTKRCNQNLNEETVNRTKKRINNQRLRDTSTMAKELSIPRSKIIKKKRMENIYDAGRYVSATHGESMSQCNHSLTFYFSPLLSAHLEDTQWRPTQDPPPPHLQWGHFESKPCAPTLRGKDMECETLTNWHIWHLTHLKRRRILQICSWTDRRP